MESEKIYAIETQKYCNLTEPFKSYRNTAYNNAKNKENNKLITRKIIDYNYNYYNYINNAL